MFSPTYTKTLKNCVMMDERLKREFDKWMEENEDTAGFFNPEELAQHFYNLALEDVKKESEKH